MNKNASTKLTLSQWEKSFRADAKADGYLAFQDQLSRLEQPENPALLLDGTIVFVQMCVAYLALDGQDAIEFLQHQTYDPKKAGNALYTAIFNIHGKAYARVNLPASLRPIDLADLYGVPWDDYEVVGYSDIWFSRIDEAPLGLDEVATLEKVVIEDLRYDYSEEELRVWFDPDTYEGVLNVSVQDVYDEDDFEDEEDEDASNEDSDNRSEGDKNNGRKE